MKTKKLFIVLILLIALMGAILIVIKYKNSKVTSKSSTETQNKVYRNSKFGFSFEYPSSYKIIEKTLYDPSKALSVAVEDESNNENFFSIEVYTVDPENFNASDNYIHDIVINGKPAKRIDVIKP